MSLKQKVQPLPRKFTVLKMWNTARTPRKLWLNLRNMVTANCRYAWPRLRILCRISCSFKGAPTGFTLQVKNCRISAGAGFVVVLTGDILTMPGLPKVPAAEKIDVSDDGVISGLF
jgi:hypothetical protein